MITFDKLIGKIAEKGYSQRRLANAIGISANSLTNKLKGRSPFDAKEISKICAILEISTEEIGTYFFVAKV